MAKNIYLYSKIVLLVGLAKNSFKKLTQKNHIHDDTLQKIPMWSAKTHVPPAKNSNSFFPS